jgi:hypothetical protein
MNILANRIRDVMVTRDRLKVFLADGREISSPLAWYPTLRRATPAQSRAWKTCGAGTGIHWIELDHHLSAEGLLRGAREARRPTARAFCDAGSR